MIINYIKIAFRNIARNKGYTFINVAGLSVGLTVCFLIILFVRAELSVDRFHENSERIYRIVSIPEESGFIRISPMMPPLLGPLLAAELPEIQQYVRFYHANDVLIRTEESTDAAGSKQFYEDKFVFVDSTFFDVFSFTLVRGDIAHVLNQPFSVIFTESKARKYFGDEDPIGKTIRYGDGYVFRITGIVEDCPELSTLQFNFLASLLTLNTIQPQGVDLSSWEVFSYPTFLLLYPGATLTAVEEKAIEVIRKHFPRPSLAAPNFQLEPLKEIYLFSEAERHTVTAGSIRYIFIFTTIAILILLIACINYINLATARASRRTLEIGVRKLVGANRSQLLWQFIGESVILSIIAYFFAIALVELTSNGFSNIVQRTVGIDFRNDFPMLLILFLFTIATGVGAGSYPALLLARFKPVDVLKKIYGTGPKGAGLRKGLVVFQFAVSGILILSTVVIQNQLDFIRQKNLGLEKEGVVVLPVKQANPVRQHAEVFKHRLSEIPYIERVSIASTVPTQSTSRFRLHRTEKDDYIHYSVFGIDENFIDIFEIELVKGTPFTEDNRRTAALINETTAKSLNWDDPVGRTVQSPLRKIGERTVVGVIADFHFQSLHEMIEPVIMFDVNDLWTRYIAVKIHLTDVEAVLTSIKTVWDEFAPDYPFEYFFLDDAFDRFYRAEDRFAEMFNFFSFLAIFISCLGLLGLATYVAERRTKEIGIRKVLGASITGIIALIVKDFLKLVIIAVVISTPVGYYIMNRWLEDFAYRIEIGLWIFALTFMIVLIIAIATVSFQTVRAAIANPVESLRYE